MTPAGSGGEAGGGGGEGDKGRVISSLTVAVVEEGEGKFDGIHKAAEISS